MIKLLFVREQLIGRVCRLFISDNTVGSTACPDMKCWVPSWHSVLFLWITKAEIS